MIKRDALDMTHYAKAKLIRRARVHLMDGGVPINNNHHIKDNRLKGEVVLIQGKHRKILKSSSRKGSKSGMNTIENTWKICKILKTKVILAKTLAKVASSEKCRIKYTNTLDISKICNTKKTLTKVQVDSKISAKASAKAADSKFGMTRRSLSMAYF